MPVGIFIIAHEPLASAFKTCSQHVYSSVGDGPADYIEVLDVPACPNIQAVESKARECIARVQTDIGVLIFTDIYGATPSNIALKLVDTTNVRLVAGINLAAIIAVLNKREGSLDDYVALAESAAHAGIVCPPVPNAAKY